MTRVVRRGAERKNENLGAAPDELGQLSGDERLRELRKDIQDVCETERPHPAPAATSSPVMAMTGRVTWVFEHLGERLE